MVGARAVGNEAGCEGSPDYSLVVVQKESRLGGGVSRKQASRMDELRMG